MAEKNIEEKLIKLLVETKGYEYIQFKNKVEFEENIIKQLSKLNNREISLEELEKIKGDIKQRIGSSTCYANKFHDMLKSGVFLRSKTGTGTDKIKLMSASASENKFQVSHQIRDEKGKARYDVTILINGFPLVQIELKNKDVEINAAVNQINRYIDSAFTDWYRYVLLFIVSNETNTRYVINNNTKLDKNFMFRWSDEKNELIDNLYKFADTFLDRNNLFDVLTNYIVKYKSDNGRMIVMRPYQIFAVKAAIDKIRKPLKTTRSTNDNGFIFHTTGSGKTLTSYKLSEIAAMESDVSKVLFLVDRKDLDSQTAAEFKSIDTNLDIEDSESTAALLKKFKSSSKIIITTIQKLNNAVKKASNPKDEKDAEYANVLGAYKNSKIILIIDECHRTQFGDMHSNIENYFTQSRKIGFTGTPIYKENALNNEKTTESLFGSELHSYRIENAIKDKNVLGFSIDYHNTVRGNSKIAEAAFETSDTYSVDSAEIIEHPKRIEAITKKIFEVHDKKTQNRRYTALFATQSIPALIKYYDEFKRINATLPEEQRLRVSAIFTATDNTESGDAFISSKNKLNDIISDFNAEFGVNCQDVESFRAEITRSLKCLREPHLDILIVVNMFLTGFDSKKTNTLYVDKNLVYHGLLQAFSRTNRVETEKKSFGNIVCFRPIKEAVDEAVKLFNYGGTSIIAITKTYENCLDKLIEIANEVMKSVPEDLNMAESTETQKVDFVKAMRKLNQAVQEIKQFAEFTWDSISECITEDQYRTLVGQLKNIEVETHEETEKESILQYIDFYMELVEQDKIDIEYIKQLIENIEITSVTETESFAKNIKDLVNKSTNDNIINKKDIIIRFLDKLVMEHKEGQIDNHTDITAHFRKFVEDERKAEIKALSLDTGLSKEELQSEIDTYTIVGKVDGSSIREKVTANNPRLGLIKRKSFVKQIKEFIPNVLKRFDFF